MQFQTPLNTERGSSSMFTQWLHNLHSTVPCCTDVEHVDGLIFLPKKAFNSFCTWMLLPTVRYTPSCVAPKMKMGEEVKAVRGDEGEHKLDTERGVEMYHTKPARIGPKMQTLQPDLPLWVRVVVSQMAILWAKRESWDWRNVSQL